MVNAIAIAGLLVLSLWLLRKAFWLLPLDRRRRPIGM